VRGDIDLLPDRLYQAAARRDAAIGQRAAQFNTVRAAALGRDR